MGGGASKTSSDHAPPSGSAGDPASPNGKLSSKHPIVDPWISGVSPLTVPRLPPRRVRHMLEQHTVKAPAPRAASDSSGPGAGTARGGLWMDKSDVVVMASPANGQLGNPAPKLRQLKEMLQNGLIEQSDYEERKRQLLDGMIMEEFDDVLTIADRALASAATSGLSPAGAVGTMLVPGVAQGLGVELGVVLKTARVKLLVKPLDEDLDPWERQRWWESDVGREERLLKLSAGTDELSWHAISSGEKLGAISLRKCTLRRTTTRPRGQGTPGFVLSSCEVTEGDETATECHVRMLPTDGGGGTAEVAAFEEWMDALAPFLPRHGVGVSLRFLQRLIVEHPEIASSSATGTGKLDGMTSADVYERFISRGLSATESYVDRLLRDPNASSSGLAGKQPHEIGPTTAFVSHCHESSFSELVATLAQIELRAQKADQHQFRSYYWIDLFCQGARGPKAASVARTAQAKGRSAILHAFNEADVDGCGSLAKNGFATALQKVGVHHAEPVLRSLLVSLGVSGNGTRIQLPEFEAVVSEYWKTHPVQLLPSGSRDSNCSVREEMVSRRRCISAAWHPSNVPTLLLILSEWPAPKALVERLECWHELMLSIEVGADMRIELSPAARLAFMAQVGSAELSFTFDQRPRWNRGRSPTESGGVDGYSSGLVAQAIDIRAVVAHTKSRATIWERAQARKRAMDMGIGGAPHLPHLPHGAKDVARQATDLPSQPSAVQPARTTTASKWTKGVNAVGLSIRYLRDTQAEGDTEPLPDMQDVSDDSDGVLEDVQIADPPSQPSAVQPARTTTASKWTKGVNAVGLSIRYLRDTQAEGDTEPLPDMQDVSDDSDGVLEDNPATKIAYRGLVASERVQQVYSNRLPARSPPSQPSVVQRIRDIGIDQLLEHGPGAHWLSGPGAEEADWVLHQVEQLPTLTIRGQGGRWVTSGVERLNMAVRNALEEELYSLYHDSGAHFAAQG